MAGIDEFVVFGSHLDGVDGATTATDFSTAQAAKTITLVGNAQIDTAQSKFGGASLLCDGTGDYCTVPDSDDFSFGAGNFTIDFWVRFASVSAVEGFGGQRVDSNNQWQFFKNTAVNLNKIRIFFVSAGTTKADYVMTDAWVPLIDTWYHIAVVRNGTSILLFIDGTSQTLTETVAISTNDLGNVAADFQFPGTGVLGGSPLNGWLDEYRISKGVARWTANFTPPTSPYSEGENRANNMCLMGVA